MKRDEVYTLKEVAILLRVANRTIYTMAQSGQLPGFKVRGQWRFVRKDIEVWIEEQKTSVSKGRGDV